MNLRYSALALLVASTTALAADLGNLSGGHVSRGSQLTPVTLESPPSASLVNTRREPVSTSWPVSADSELAATPAASGDSKSYWFRTSGLSLSTGIAIDTSAPGALVRINAEPRDGESAVPESLMVDPAQLEVTTPSGAVLSGAQAFSQSLKGQAKADDANLLGIGTSAFRFAATQGSGKMLVRSHQPLDPSRRYLVQVYEPDSTAVLHVSANRDAYLSGETLSLAGELDQAGKPVRLTGASGTLTAPDGRQFRLRFGADGTAKLPLAAASSVPGLWDVELAVMGPVRRNVRTAIAVAAPTARIGTGLQLSQGAAGQLIVRVPVEIAAAGRYEVSGVVYGHAADGSLKPAAAAASAAWLEGSDALVLNVAGTHLAQSGLQPPYELRDLRLTDQSRLAVLERQERGYRFGSR